MLYEDDGGSLFPGLILVRAKRGHLWDSKPRWQGALPLQLHALHFVDGRPVLAGLCHGEGRLDLSVVVLQLMDDGPLSVEVFVGGANLAILLDLTLHLKCIVDPVADRAFGMIVLVV